MKKIKLLIISAVICIFAFTIQSLGAEQKIEPAYVNVQIFEGDSLWSVASSHPHDGMGIHAYIREIKTLNGLKNDRIQAGCRLIVPIYQRP